MSDVQQFGQHPDADQISAFVEHALPAHEREQVFAHLAVCAECREWVALSMPAIDEPAKPLPTPVRRPWWSGWTLALPAAAVLAGLSAFAIYVHQAGDSQPPAQVAGVREAAPAAGQPEAPVPQPKQAPRAAIANKLAGAKTGNPGDPSAARSLESLPLSGRNLAEMNAPAPRPVLRAESRATTPAADARAGKAGPAAMATAGAPAPPPAPAAAPVSAGNTQTAEAAAGASPIEAESLNATGAELSLKQMQPAPFIALKHSLPSGLAVLSIATHGRLTLAIDLHNAVFLSNDAGKHWKPIAVPWQGHAVKAELVAFAPAGPTAFSLDKAAAIGGLQSESMKSSVNLNGALAAPAAAPGVSLTGTVTDPSGAVVSGATVEINDSATHTARTVKTDAAGRYLVDGLAPGTYRVEAMARGFESRVLGSVAVTAGRATVADLTLTIGAETESVTVEAAPLADSAAAKTDKKSKQAVALFSITTNNGERWTSPDGVTWQHQ